VTALLLLHRQFVAVVRGGTRGGGDVGTARLALATTRVVALALHLVAIATHSVVVADDNVVVAVNAVLVAHNERVVHVQCRALAPIDVAVRVVHRLSSRGCSTSAAHCSSELDASCVVMKSFERRVAELIEDRVHRVTEDGKRSGKSYKIRARPVLARRN